VTEVVVPETPARPRPRWGVRAVLLAVVAALAVMWIYVLFIGKADTPNHLADESWAPKAEAVCAATAARIAALPPAASFAHITPLDEALRRRADVGQQATALLDRQLAELRGLPPPSGPHDGKLLAAWFADWDRYLADRREHVAQWEAGHDKPFAETEVNGGPISDRMDYLSTLNGMDSCVVPADFG
jgi:hypothetical protein